MLYNDLNDGIFIMHENPEWIPPFKEAFEKAGVKFGEILLTDGSIDLTKAPPKGVFWSRLSASSHTRNNLYSKEYGRAVLAWLEAYGRRIINGSSVLEFEVSKIKQYLALEKFGFRVPKTIAVFGKNDLINRAKDLQTPFITKHNQGGKGLGVRLFESLEEFDRYVNSDEFEQGADDITLLQEYIRSKEPFITRVEFIGGKFHYAVRVDTSGGAFELCPAEACEIENRAKLPQIAGGACDVGFANKFSLREDITHNFPLVQKLEEFLKLHKIEVAGVEFIESDKNEFVIYDINTNTNYNKAVEQSKRAKNELGAADRIVEFLESEFKKEIR
ncbi:ATP-grasp domain-containing protein [Campylobacter porcelli]|uniref:Alpha-L-glutamate ligase n=1 Tax=Campylobacter porcelli TaxID=1660073 RepID=A0ABU7M3J7_9BACT|nr:alpha-L-glutamate ligase [Campylobacter sp. CX2-4855-23]